VCLTNFQDYIKQKKTMKKIKQFRLPPDSASVVLVCVVWNELLLLQFFIDHYKTVGVEHFIFIDNNSDDGTTEYLISRDDVNIELYAEHGSYRDAKFGIDWVNSILNETLQNKWCLVVDIDELLILKDGMLLPQLAVLMESVGANIAETVLVDFYPRAFDESVLQQGLSFFNHSNCFHKFTNNNILVRRAPDGSLDVKGGVRHVISNGQKKPNSSSVCLSKKSFFKYNFHKTHQLSVGMHWILPKDFTCWWPPEHAYHGWAESNVFLNFFKDIFVMAHFKYVKPDILNVFQARVDRNQDWNNSSEYRSYVNCATSSYFDPNLSVAYTCVSQLYSNTICNIIE